MALSIGTANWRLRRQAPVSRVAAPAAKRAPLWPTFSIALLLCLPSLFAPIAITVLNAALVGLAVAVVLATNRRIDPRLLVIMALVGVVACLGFVMGRGVDLYEYFKDAWYIVNPMLVLLTGYVLYSMKPDLGRGLRAFVIAGLVVALWQLRGYAIEPSLIQLPAAQIRSVIGTGSYVPVVGLVILIVFVGKWRSVLGLPNWLAGLFLVVMALAVAGVFSRAAVVVVAIGFAALIGCFSRREWWRVGLPAVLLVLAGFLAQLYVDTESDFALQTFGGKMARTLQELTVGDSIAARDINLNFRAYETDRVLDQFAQSSVPAMLFGQGFGATVDLGVTMPLMVTETGFRGVRHIGVFHNGYVYLLTKVGLLGLVLYGAVLVYLYRIGRSRATLPIAQTEAAAGRLFQFAIVTLAATTYFIAGVFNRADMFPVLLLTGFLLAHWRDKTDA
jgi:O-antigen ligase